MLLKRRSLDEQLDGSAAHPALKTLSDRDRALMRRIAATVLRRLGTLRAVLSRLVDRGLPNDLQRAETALLIGAAQILWMDVPDHAAVDLSVRLVQADRRAAKYVGLVNAVLRRCAREGTALADDVAETLPDLPSWLRQRWSAHYGESATRAIAAALSHEPALDITVKSDAEHWASRLQGEVLPTGSIRTRLHGPVAMLPGFDDGAWWVQDAAAALPARLFGDIAGRRVADLCAAPGGKTAQLAQSGAQVTALIARLAAARACAAIWRGFASMPRSLSPTPPNGTMSRSTPSCSMRPAPPPAPADAIPTSLGSNRRATSRRWPVCRCGAAAKGRRVAQVRWHAGLLRLLARAGGRRADDRRLSRHRSRPEARPDRRS